jgi:crossover junction endodeoxyribonuclease RuvC
LGRLITIGIDPGLSGAIGVLIDGKFNAVYDMPTMAKGGSGSVKYQVNPSGVLAILKALDYDNRIQAGLELVNAMPGQGVSSVFSLGDSYGCARAILAACNISSESIVPRAWKRYFKLGPDKEQARSLAILKFPNAELHLKKHADRAESLLLSLYVWENSNG